MTCFLKEFVGFHNLLVIGIKKREIVAAKLWKINGLMLDLALPDELFVLPDILKILLFLGHDSQS